MRTDDIVEGSLCYVWSSVSDHKFTDRHCHAHYEMYYFVQGDIEYKVEGRLYTMAPESLLLIPPNVFHGSTVKSESLHKRISIHFLPELIDEAERKPLLECFHAEHVYYPDIQKTRIGILAQALLDCKSMKEPVLQIALRHRIISLLTHVHQMCARPYTAPPDERIQGVLWFLNSHLRTPLSINDVVNRFHISRNHLNVLFRAETGTTVNQYIRIKRLALARQEMRDGCGAEEAAYKAGFNDYSNFFRAYKAIYGRTPSQRNPGWEAGGIGE